MNILIHPEAVRAFNNGARQNISGSGSQLQTLAYLLGYETDGNIKTTELIFPYQHGTSESVYEIGKKIRLSRNVVLFPTKYCFFRSTNYNRDDQIVMDMENLWRKNSQGVADPLSSTMGQ